MSLTDPKAYLRNAVMQAAPEQLQLMLYDAAIRNAMQAKDAITAGDFECSYEKLSKAQAIVIEMQAGLRPEVNEQLCEQMSALYNFIHRKLVDACVHRETAPIDDALTILNRERDTWKILVKKVTEAKAEYAHTGESDPAAHEGLLSVEG